MKNIKKPKEKLTGLPKSADAKIHIFRPRKEAKRYLDGMKKI